MATHSKEELGREKYICYKLDNITYLPHYKKDCFVGPNYSAYEGCEDEDGGRLYFTSKEREYSAKQLENYGATKVVKELWIRVAHKPV